MANYTFTSNTNSVLVDVNGKQAAFGDKELHPYTPDRSGNVVYLYDLTGILKKIGTPSTHQESNRSKDRIPLDITVDTIDVNGTNTWADAGALLDALRAIFFLASADSPLIPDSQRVNTFADLPDPVASDGQYWVVDQATGTWILGTRREAGIYKAVAGAWTYRGADVPYYLLDDQFTIKDGFDNSKQLGFEVNLVSPGQRRIATWQDKDITVADNVDVVAGDTGTVTIHSDVDDAGSGEIITDQERIDINASIEVHDDVDLAGVSSLDNTILKWNGTDFIPTLKQVFTNPNLIINNTAVLQDAVNVQVNIQRLVPHLITISYGWSLNDGGNDFVAAASLGGLDLITGLTDNSEIHRQEPKDVGGGDPDGRGTNQRHRFTGKFFVTPTALGSNTLLLQVAGGAAGGLASIWNTIIEIEEYVTIS